MKKWPYKGKIQLMVANEDLPHSGFHCLFVKGIIYHLLNTTILEITKGEEDGYTCPPFFFFRCVHCIPVNAIHGATKTNENNPKVARADGSYSSTGGAFPTAGGSTCTE